MRLKRYQKEFDHSYTFGVFTTFELLATQPRRVVSVVLATKAAGNAGADRLLAVCAENGIPTETSDKVIERLSPRKSHLAVGVFKKHSSSLDQGRNHVVLVAPADMGNVGTICRTMVGFGVYDLALIRPAVDIFDPRTVRASMGSMFRMSCEYFDSFEDYSRRFGHRVYPLMSNGAESIRTATLERPFALVFGNESSGLPDEFLGAGMSIRIPQGGQVDSLNLASAAAIALYESAAP